MNTYKILLRLAVVSFLCFGYCQLEARADVFPKRAILTKFKYLTFMKPIGHAPKRDTFKYNDTANFTGKIAYSPLSAGRDNQAGPVTRYIVVRTLTDGKQTLIRTLPVQTSQNVYGFQFSPDGNTLLFKIGTPFTNPADPYDILFWNMTTNKISIVPKNPNNYDIAFYRVCWSPSGRYIAYCRGGDVNGNEYPFPNDYRPLRLYTYDLESHAERFIAKASSVRYFTWTNSDKLLFSMKSAKYVKWQHKNKKHDNAHSPLLNIYQSSPTGKTIRLLIKDGFVVYPSPDEKKFIFMSHEDIEQRQHHKKNKNPPEHVYTDYSHPMLYNVQRHDFKSVKFEGGRPQKIIWRSDEDKALLAQYDYESGKKGVFHLNQLNLSDMTQKQITKFVVHDQSYFDGNISYHHFENIALSQNMDFLSLMTVRYGKLIHHTYGDYPDRFESIKVANMRSGQIHTICTLHRFGDIASYNLH